MDLVHMVDNEVFTTSMMVAEKFGKTHFHVMEAIKKLQCSQEFRASNFRCSSYTTSQNKVLACYEITIDGFSILGMGFKGDRAAQWKEKYINAFNSMHTELISRKFQITELEDLVKAVEMIESDSSKSVGQKLDAVANINMQYPEISSKAGIALQSCKKYKQILMEKEQGLKKKIQLVFDI